MSHFNHKFFRLVPVFGLFFMVSCAGNGQPLTEAGPKSGDSSSANVADDYFGDYESSPAAGGNSSKNGKSGKNDSYVGRTAKAGSVGSDYFGFKLPNGGEGWTLISGPDAGESGVPYEFYNARTGRRAVLMEVELPKGEPMRLMDRAQMEMQAFESSGKKATLAETYPEEAFGSTGAFFDVAGKRYDTPYEAVGLVTGAGNHVYSLTLSATDNVPEAGKLKEEWKEFFNDFEMMEETEESGPELSPERVQKFESEALGYTWSVKDTLWHY